MPYSHNTNLKESINWKMKSRLSKDFLKDIISRQAAREEYNNLLLYSLGHTKGQPLKNHLRI